VIDLSTIKPTSHVILILSTMNPTSHMINFINNKTNLSCHHDVIDNETNLSCHHDFIHNKTNLSCNYDFIKNKIKLSHNPNFINNITHLSCGIACVSLGLLRKCRTWRIFYTYWVLWGHVISYECGTHLDRRNLSHKIHRPSAASGERPCSGRKGTEPGQTTFLL
jgi:hypothetical protein